MGSNAISRGRQLIWHPSPNFNQRRGGAAPSLVVLHYTAMQDAPSALERLCDPAFEVSAHYLIAKDGCVFQMVDETLRAWHAGAGSWGGQGDVNSRSIGIELCNCGTQDFPKAQIDALCQLLRGMRNRWNIPAQNVIGHSDMAPDRKSDPGRLFPWARLMADGLAVGAETSQQGSAACFRTMATKFGYGTEFTTADVLEAFRQRFRPDATGPETAMDRGVMERLAMLYPVDEPAPKP